MTLREIIKKNPNPVEANFIYLQFSHFLSKDVSSKENNIFEKRKKENEKVSFCIQVHSQQEVGKKIAKHPMKQH